MAAMRCDPGEIQEDGPFRRSDLVNHAGREQDAELRQPIVDGGRLVPRPSVACWSMTPPYGESAIPALLTSWP